MSEVVNMAAYCFANPGDVKSLRERLMEFCREQGLKGTILLSQEGINLFVAGTKEAVEALLKELKTIPGMADMEVKFSTSERQPFRRMLVRIKKEIIAFGVEGINPSVYTSPRLPAADLKRWLDEGRDVVLLDTRNDYEIKLGTFAGAKAIGISHFRDFPGAVQTLPEEWKARPVVTFCTGGIRCEKAAPFLESVGFREVYQLDGGILRYFEECGGAHYEGECFVFDQRVGLDPSLEETGSTQCFACQSPLTEDEKKSVHYRVGVCCPHCYQPDEVVLWQNREKRKRLIEEITTPLPGSIPADNFRPLLIPASADGMGLREFLEKTFAYLEPSHFTKMFEEGRFLSEGGEVLSPEFVVRGGQRLLNKEPQNVEPPVNAAVEILHEDGALVVVNKPAPLPMHPAGRFHRNTLRHIINHAFAPARPKPLHRLDANTTGVVVFATTKHFAAVGGRQFSEGKVDKCYIARVKGWPPEDFFRCALPITAEPGRVGGRDVSEEREDGLDALTEFEVWRRLPDGTSLVKANPVTGRTNQIRIHLAALGFPVMGDPLYGNNDGPAAAGTLAVGDPPLCLHSWKLSLTHPLSGGRVTYEAPLPSWTGFED